MLKRVRPTNAWDRAAGLCIAVSGFLITWSMIGPDWWSTAIALDIPFNRNSPDFVGAADVGQSLFDGYPWLALAIIALAIIGMNLSSAVLGPFAKIKNTRYLFGVVAIGVIGVAATLGATQLDSPVRGLVTTNGWIPAIVGWLFYFGAFGLAMPARGPQLEFEEGPDSSDG